MTERPNEGRSEKGRRLFSSGPPGFIPAGRAHHTG